ncbi:hypothetical protein LCGC14_2874350 [marine sediment metagenome]|uniref:Uncharacterized protein n=1 Tax=marine sediment metagenome TaxID=412755 RepID=A0A0F8YNU2_9ZZZZ
MGLERLREGSKESGVKELWARDMSEEVEKAWEKAQGALQKIEEQKNEPALAL